MNTIPVANPKANILVVDDLKANLDLLSKMLGERGYEARCVINGSMALRVANSAWADIILLDINMPDLDGYRVCELLRDLEPTQEIPIIFLSVLDDLADRQKAFTVGASDYITKPFEIEEVVTRIENQLAIKSAREYAQELERVNRQLKQEITQRQQAEKKLSKIALYDPITGLANRDSFISRLKQAIALSNTQPEYGFAILLIDGDRDGALKQSLTYTARQKLMVAMGNALKSLIPQSGFLSRFEGQEFAIFLDNIYSFEDAAQLATKIRQQFSTAFSIEANLVSVQPHIGVALGNKQTQNVDELLRNADLAIQQVKDSQNQNQPKSLVHVSTVKSSFSQLASELQTAIDNHEFLVYYQPIVSLQSSKLVELEALIRWNHPRRGLIAPREFLPIAEATELIIPIEDFVFQEACRQIKVWQDSESENLDICLNISTKQFFYPDLINKLIAILQKTQLSGQYLKLDIPENILADRSELALDICQRLKQHQIKISIDDFGLKDSSTVDLNIFPIDSLKINRSLVSKVANNSGDAAASNLSITSIKQIISIARNQNITVTAKGIETTPQEKILRKLGCDLGQGHLFSAPVNSRGIDEFLLWA